MADSEATQAERLGGCLRTAFYAWWLSTSLRKAKLRKNWLWMFTICIFMSRKATCCGQTDLTIKARFFNKTHFRHEPLEVVTSIPDSLLFDAWLRRYSTQPVFFFSPWHKRQHAASHKSSIRRGSSLPCRGRIIFWTRVQPAVQKQDRFLTRVQPAVMMMMMITSPFFESF